jgi:hypothetical protein
LRFDVQFASGKVLQMDKGLSGRPTKGLTFGTLAAVETGDERIFVGALEVDGDFRGSLIDERGSDSCQKDRQQQPDYLQTESSLHK